MLKRLSANVFLNFAIICLCTSCALTQDRIYIDYIPQAKRVSIPEAQNINISVQVIDNRPFSRVSCKKNGFGMEMAPIVLEGDLSIIVAQAVSEELKNHGFTLEDGDFLLEEDGDFLLEVTIYKFYNDFKSGFFKAQGVAEIIVKFDVMNRQKACLYSKVIMKRGINDNIFLAIGSNAKIALDLALNSAIQDLFNDPSFVASFLN